MIALVSLNGNEGSFYKTEMLRVSVRQKSQQSHCVPLRYNKYAPARFRNYNKTIFQNI